MNNIEFKDEYWDQALDVLQVEENWKNAQVVLKKAERRQVYFRLMPVAIILLLVSSLGFWAFNSQNSYANQIKVITTSNPSVVANNKEINEFDSKTNINLESNKEFKTPNVSIKLNNVKGNEVIKDKTNNANVIVDSKIISKNKNSSKTNPINESKLNEEPQNIANANENSASNLDSGLLKSENSKEEEHVKVSNDFSLETEKPVVDQQSELNLNQGISIDMYENPLRQEKSDLAFIYNRNLFQNPFNHRSKLVENFHSIKHKRRPQMNGLSFVFGTSQFAGYGSDNRNRINPEIGLEYQRFINNNIFLVSGISYFSIEGLSHSTSYSDVEIGFDKFEEKTSFSSNKVHYLFAPLLVKWELNKYHSVSIGGGVSYFLTNNSVIETSTFENELLLSNDTENSKGFSEGYQSLNTSILGGYEFRFNRRTSLGVQYQFGLSPIVNDEVYESNNKDNNSRLRILLKRRIL